MTLQVIIDNTRSYRIVLSSKYTVFVDLLGLEFRRNVLWVPRRGSTLLVVTKDSKWLLWTFSYNWWELIGSIIVLAGWFQGALWAPTIVLQA